jgi:hypothetical protein
MLLSMTEREAPSANVQAVGLDALAAMDHLRKKGQK